MPRRSSRRSPISPQGPHPDTKAADLRLNGKPPKSLQPANPVSEDLRAGIITNWSLPTDNINSCVPPERWPCNESDPKKWPIDIVRLLYEASKHSKGDNDFFRVDLDAEILSRQSKNRSAKGKGDHMTAIDLKKVCKRLESMQHDSKDPKREETQKHGVAQPLRRGRSNGKLMEEELSKDAQASEDAHVAQEKKPSAPRGRGRPKKTEAKEQETVRTGTKRHAPDLPIRPARKLRNVKSPKAKPAIPPPVTPANPPENSDDEDEVDDDDQENKPPEPVSGRHIYGTFIKPTTIDFNAGTELEPPAQGQAQGRTRQTRKRGRAAAAADANDKPPTEVQIDSDPRDIDATGFLSELDPKETRRRRMQPRLSRLQDEPVAEPAWSQDVAALPETNGVLSPSAPFVENGEDEDFSIDFLIDLLPDIPACATVEERSMLEDRIALIHRDIVAYKMAVVEIEGRAGVE